MINKKEENSLYKYQIMMGRTMDDDRQQTTTYTTIYTTAQSGLDS